VKSENRRNEQCEKAEIRPNSAAAEMAKIGENEEKTCQRRRKHAKYRKAAMVKINGGIENGVAANEKWLLSEKASAIKQRNLA
jgi:hypothetical protein